MLKKIGLLFLSAGLALNICGCIPLVAGTAGGAGTAAWLSGKLSQEFHAPYERVIGAAKSALQSLRLELVKETRSQDVTQFRTRYTDGKEVWIDIRRISDDSTKVEVRVGAVSPDKKASDKILKRIQSYL